MRRHFTPKDHTFVICAYGRSKYLEECIESLLKQSVKGSLLIFTSTPNDHIKGLADKYGIRLLANEDSKGIASDWNNAYMSAETELVTIAHQDDIYYPDYLKESLKYINKSQAPMIAFSGYYELHGSRIVTDKDFVNLRIKRILLSPLKNKGLQKNKWLRRRILSLGNSICCPSVTYVKNNLPEKLFDEGMDTNLDWAAWEKLSKRKGSFVYIPKALMAHRIYAESVTSETIRLGVRTKEDLAILQKFWPSPVAKLINTLYSNSQNSRKKLLKH